MSKKRLTYVAAAPTIKVLRRSKRWELYFPKELDPGTAFMRVSCTATTIVLTPTNERGEQPHKAFRVARYGSVRGCWINVTRTKLPLLKAGEHRVTTTKEHVVVHARGGETGPVTCSGGGTTLCVSADGTGFALYFGAELARLLGLTYDDRVQVRHAHPFVRIRKSESSGDTKLCGAHTTRRSLFTTLGRARAPWLRTGRFEVTVVDGVGRFRCSHPAE